jgi:hypothetical protein
MAKWILFLFLVSSLLLVCNTLTAPFTPPTITPKPRNPDPTNTPVVPPPVSATEAPFNIAWDDRSLFRQNLINSAQNILEGFPGASIYHIAFSLADPPTRLTGVEDVRYTNQEAVVLTEVDLAVFSEILGGSILINNVTVDDQPVTGTHQAGLMRLSLTAPLLPGNSVVIHVEFQVTVPEMGGDSYYGIFGYNDGILSLAHAYPTILVYNEQGWNNQTPDLEGDPLFSDASFYIVSVNAPRNLILAASGTEVDRSEKMDRQQVLYANGPARDFYLAASSSFEKHSESIGELTVSSYAPANLRQYAQSALKTAEAAISVFSRRYAPYPYTEFDIVPIITSAGGVEFPGLTSIAKDIYNESDFLETVVTHEVGHQWFYNLVGNSTQGQPWLDESMAEFVTWQYYLDQYGAQAAQSYRDTMQLSWDMLNDEKISIGLPVSGYSSAEYVDIVYGRGPLFILALRERMGLVTFDQFISNYTQRFEWAISTTADFKQVAEQTCSCDLTEIFDEWVNP